MQLIPSEYNEQVSLCEFLEILKKQNKIIEYFSIENENKQSFTNRILAIRIAEKQARSGKKSGVSDMCVVLLNKVLFIEMKKRKKALKSGKLSASGISIPDSQVNFIDTVTKSNVVSGSICYGAVEAMNFITQHIKT